MEYHEIQADSGIIRLKSNNVEVWDFLDPREISHTLTTRNKKEGNKVTEYKIYVYHCNKLHDSVSSIVVGTLEEAQKAVDQIKMAKYGRL